MSRDVTGNFSTFTGNIRASVEPVTASFAQLIMVLATQRTKDTQQLKVAPANTREATASHAPVAELEVREYHLRTVHWQAQALAKWCKAR